MDSHVSRVHGMAAVDGSLLRVADEKGGAEENRRTWRERADVQTIQVRGYQWRAVRRERRDLKVSSWQ